MGLNQLCLTVAMKYFDRVILLRLHFAPIIRIMMKKILHVLLKNHGFSVTPSKGYMIHYYDKKMKAPYLRRGLIRAIR